MKGWQNSFAARLRRTQWNMAHGVSTLNPGQRLRPTRRFKVETAYLPPKIGFTSWRDWEFDEADARRIAQRCADSREYKWVKLISMTKINGRWTRYTSEEIFPASSNSPIPPMAKPGDSNGEASVSKLPAAASPSAVGNLHA
jgi:hypothetical protein